MGFSYARVKEENENNKFKYHPLPTTFDPNKEQDKTKKKKLIKKFDLARQSENN